MRVRQILESIRKEVKEHTNSLVNQWKNSESRRSMSESESSGKEVKEHTNTAATDAEEPLVVKKPNEGACLHA